MDSPPSFFSAISLSIAFPHDLRQVTSPSLDLDPLTYETRFN